MNYLPGNTILSSQEFQSHSLTSFHLPSTRPVIILASNDVNDTTLFLNGLTQNIIILYHQFEALGYTSYLLQNPSNEQHNKKKFIFNYNTISQPDIIKSNLPIKAIIEIGMSIDKTTRHYLRSIGTKIIKLYLGNILNIDIETIQHYSSMFFHHHIVGEIDEIWTSPHYEQHLHYAALLNQIEIKNSTVVPYVWEPFFINQYGTKESIEWIPPESWITQDIVIMDPNISFQKCSFYSLLLIEAFSKKYPKWNGHVYIINGDRFKLCTRATNNFLPYLSMYTNERIHLLPRSKIHDILQSHRSALFLTHQWNNDYNYMTLELLYCNYPILHNSEGWSNFGYYYSINEWNKAIETLYTAFTSHKQNLMIYKSHAANLIWKHSIHNPSIQERWKQFLPK
jgi:hypothetical protein